MQEVNIHLINSYVVIEFLHCADVIKILLYPRNNNNNITHQVSDLRVGHQEDEVDECGSQQLTKRPTQSLLVHVQEPDEPQLLHNLATRHMTCVRYS